MTSPVSRAAIFAGLLLASCSGGDNASSAIARGDYTLTANGTTLVLARAGTTLLSFPADGFEIGIVGALDDDASYDPYWLEAKNGAIMPDPPKGLRFQRLESAAISRPDDATLRIDQTYEGNVTARLELHAEDASNIDDTGARFSATLTPISAPPIAFLRLRPRASSEEAYYGLGDAPDDVNHKGKLRPMQIEADLELESADNEAHVPVPLLIGTRGWGVFVESKRAGLFDVARKEPDLVEITYGTAQDSAAGLRFHLFGARTPLDVTQQYYEVTGYPLLPATWAYGPWIWRDENRDQAEVEDDIRQIRDLDLATSAIWIDRPYATKVNSFDWDPARYTDPARMIARAHDAGLRVALWSTPYLEEGTEPLLGEAKSRGFFPPETNLLLNGWGKPIDFTNPDAFAWWQSLIARYTDMGIEGFKLDYAEDIAVGIAGGRTEWRFFDGSDERTMHYGYTVLYHRAYAEKLPASGGFLLCRAGRWGDQKNVSVIWPGDLDASLTRFRERYTPRGETDEILGVGGLPTSVIMGLNLGPSGFPFYASDTGGYRHSPPDRETYTRWFEQTALSSIMEVGDSSSQPPWVFTTANGRDQATLDLYRVYARLHLRLFPYAWTYAKRTQTDGRPVTRSFGLAYPEYGAHPSDEYLFGDELLVAPVLSAAMTARELVLPAGEWVDWWDGTRHSGGAGGMTISVAAPLEKLPLFLRAGGIVPLLRPSIDTLSPSVATSTSADGPTESWANDPGVLYLRIATGTGVVSSFTVYDGTKIELDGTAVSVTAGSEYRSGFMLEIIALGAEPAAVTLDGAPLAKPAWSFAADEAGGTLSVSVPAGDHRVAF